MRKKTSEKASPATCMSDDWISESQLKSVHLEPELIYDTGPSGAALVA
jgi:hypothetical protein